MKAFSSGIFRTSCAAVDKILTAVVYRAVPLRKLSFLYAALEWKCDFRVGAFYGVAQKHYLGDIRK